MYLLLCLAIELLINQALAPRIGNMVNISERFIKTVVYISECRLSVYLAPATALGYPAPESELP
jgi:hypothetical protein